MSFDVDEVLGDMVEAAGGVLGEHIEDIRDFAETEFKKLADTAELIIRLRADGKIDDDEARLHFRLQKNATQIVLLAIEGLGILAVEQALNAAINVLKNAVNTATGFALV